MGYPPVVVVDSGGVPRTQVAEGGSAPAATVSDVGRPITLTDNAPPIMLYDGSGAPWTPYSAEAVALFARFTTQPTTARKVLVNNLIVSLKTADVWTKLDALYVMAAADSQAGRQNWVQDLYNLTAVSGPVFVADRGYTGDGAASYLETNFNPTTAVSPKFQQNSANMGIWSRTDLANAGSTSFDIGQTANAYLGRTGATPGSAAGRPNAASGQTIGLGAYPKQSAWTRSAAAVWEGYAQGADSGGGTTASVAPGSSTIRILAANAAFGVNQIAAAHFGGNLTAGEVAALYTALNTYLTAVGAA